MYEFNFWGGTYIKYFISLIQIFILFIQKIKKGQCDKTYLLLNETILKEIV